MCGGKQSHKTIFSFLLTFSFMICLVFCGYFCCRSPKRKRTMVFKREECAILRSHHGPHWNQRGKGIRRRMPGFIEYLLCARHCAKSLTCIASLNFHKSHIRPCERHSIALVIREKNRKTIRQYPKLSE